jgi:signal transduction histidine kinase
MIHSVRWRILALLTATIGMVLYCGFAIREAHLETTAITESLRYSHDLESQAWRWTVDRPDAEELRSAQAITDPMQPDQRREAWRRLVHAVSERSSTVKAKADFFRQTEIEFRRFQSNRLPFWQDRLRYFAALFLGTILISMAAMLMILRGQIFTPLKGLARKMTDFLNDRYTYQFTVPAPTEIGQLQATFNSLAQRVLRTMEELTSLDHAKSEFLSIASHELRTPLTSIKGSLSLLKSGVTGPMNEMATNLLNIAEQETDRLIRLINELLDLAKIEAGKFEARSEWHPLGDLIEKTFASLSGLAQSAGVAIEAKDLAPVKVNIDHDRIQQVLTNLLSNAIKFSPKGATVQVTAQIDDRQELKISVTDQGRGIAPEDQDAIFQKFRQATSAKNPLVKGTGLGLAIAKALVEEHGGRIGVTSVPGQGSTFYFTLPQWQYSRDQVNSNPIQPGVAA